ncbi:STAS domain-containing protein [Microbacterium sp. R86528]|uniref:STAS domain-containing protein n=1 Tax=Microbacterium sp. R86528 TaxID=3093864 RepID=UPI0037CC4117
MRVKTEQAGGSATVELAGRFDANEVDEFRRAIDAVLGSATTSVVIDLSQVVFIDSSALAELVRVHKAAAQSGATLTLGTPSTAVRVILEITDLDKVFNISVTPAAGNAD